MPEVAERSVVEALREIRRALSGRVEFEADLEPPTDYKLRGEIVGLELALAAFDAVEIWHVGQRLRHPAGSEWELVEHVGGEGDDWRGRCVVGTVRAGYVGGEAEGKEQVFHREYMDRTFTTVQLAEQEANHA